MSIQIQTEKCIGCRQCIEVCPGNLIKINPKGKAYIRCVRDCWGCTSCLKECRVGAIDFFLGADMGGMGSRLSVSEQGNLRTWTVTKPNGFTVSIQVDKKASNKY